MIVVEVIPFSNFKEKIRITKAAKGKVTILNNVVMIERVEEE
jgi:hypothetical protein